MTKAIINGIIVTQNAELKDKVLLFNEKILGIVDADYYTADEVIDAKGNYVCPGLVDVASGWSEIVPVYGNSFLAMKDGFDYLFADRKSVV